MAWSTDAISAITIRLRINDWTGRGWCETAEFKPCPLGCDKTPSQQRKRLAVVVVVDMILLLYYDMMMMDDDDEKKKRSGRIIII